MTTGGTSGMPMRFYIDNYRARAKEVAFVETINSRYFGCRFFDRQIMLRGDCCLYRFARKTFSCCISTAADAVVFPGDGNDKIIGLCYPLLS